MSLKFEIETLEGLDEATQKLYAKQDNGKYRLAVEGLPESEDVKGLKAKVEELLGEKKKAAEAAKKAEEEAAKTREENARKRGDIEALEKSWNEKHTAALGEKDGEIKRLNAAVHSVLVDSVASRLANELALQGSASVLEPHIRNRLTVEHVDGLIRDAADL